MKITKKELNEMIEESVKLKLNEISKSGYDRMSGLVAIKDEKELLKIAGRMIDEFEDEGFESNEIIDYFSVLIGKAIK